MNKKSKAPVVALATIGISLVGVLLIIILWMNLTPGYFQYGPCGCSVGYYTDEEISSIQVKCLTMCYVSRPGRVLKDFLLLMSHLDLNRGRSEALSIRDYVCPKTDWINCMPIVAPGEPSQKCEKSYLDWAKKSCPNFQGGAY